VSSEYDIHSEFALLLQLAHPTAITTISKRCCCSTTNDRYCPGLPRRPERPFGTNYESVATDRSLPNRDGDQEPGSARYRAQYGLMHVWLLHTRPRTQAFSQ
jgi:hypothetical protein